MTTRIIIGDARARLAELPAESVHCVVTSPPYWGLRDYGTARWDGGDPACAHLAASNGIRDKGRDRAVSGGKLRPHSITNRRVVKLSEECGHCGARRIDSQIGLESDYREYVATLVAVFREVRRVLRADGTLWLNLGDSYAGGGTIGRNDTGPADLARRSAAYGTGTGTGTGSAVGASGSRPAVTSLKEKDLCGIPWRVAFALQDDGWYLRQDIIWSKPNPMPESVTDRCTKAHEYLFLLSKSARYWFDADAIAEPSVYPDDKRRPVGSKGAWQIDGREQRANGGGVAYDHDTITRNKRSVWTVATAPFSEAHFATFPPALIEPCILAGCPRNGTVLDPFLGAGTTALVADRLGRNCIGIELNPAYAAMAQRRIDDDAGMFAETWCEAAQ